MNTRILAILALTACRPFLPEHDGTDTNPADTDRIDTDLIDTDSGAIDTGTEDFPLGDWDHLADAPWGMTLNIVDIGGATGPDGVFEVGDVPTITFTAVDDDGVPYIPDDFTSLQFGVTGPTTHMDIVYYGPDNEGDASNIEPVAWDPTEAPQGVAWRFTFPTPIPSVYHAAPNDTLDIGEDLGDWGGLPLVPGTYLFGLWGHTRHDDDTQPVFDTASDVSRALLGAGAVDSPRERVLTSNCNKCHGDLEMHDRRIAGDVSVCLMCHVMGSEDAYSAQEPTTTNGLSLFLPVIIHKVHAGTYLTQPYIVNAAPTDPTDPNWPNFRAKDYSNVTYTTLPSGTAECFTCHGGAAQGDVQDRSTRSACGACHDAIVWSTGEGHGTGGVANDDLTCANNGCHPPSTIVLDHRDPRFDPAQNPGLNLDILRVTGGSGTGAQFLPGDRISVEYTVTDDDGGRVNVPTELMSGYLRMAGPLEHLQFTMEQKDLATASTEDIVNHTWKYTASATVPAVYPPQPNDTATLGVADGDWKGLPLANGTYRLMLSGYTNLTLADATMVRVPVATTTEVLVGTATHVEARAPVDQVLCEACHNKLWVHGDSRTNVSGCPICHTAGAEDRYSSTDPTTTPGVTIEFPIMIHRLHNGARLSQPYVVNGYAPAPGLFTAVDFSDVEFPRMDGGTTNCAACHVEGGYNAISGHVCASCHDSATTAAHIALTTDPIYGESCLVCHGPDKDQSVAHVHGLE